MKVTPKDSIEEKNAREKRIKERRMKHKKPKKRFQFLKNPFFWILLFMAYVLYVGHNQTKLLNDNYKITTGYIYKKGSWHGWYLHYYFNVYSAEFHGGSSSFEGKKVGDTIQVRYYVPNPAINRWEGEFH